MSRTARSGSPVIMIVSVTTELSHMDPESFPRRGLLLASVNRILEVTFGRVGGPYLE